MKYELTALKKLLIALSMTNPEELDCGDCHEHIDQFADMLQEGKDPEIVLPLVKRHLELCHDCHEEFEALSIALDSMNNAEN